MCWLPHQNNIPVDLSALSKSIYKQKAFEIQQKRMLQMSLTYLLTIKNLFKDKITSASNNIQPGRLSYERLMNEFMNYHFHQVQNTRDLELLVMIIGSIINN